MVVGQGHPGDAHPPDDHGEPVVVAVRPPSPRVDGAPVGLDAHRVDAVHDPTALFGGEIRMEPIVGQRQVFPKHAGTQIGLVLGVGLVAPFGPDAAIKQHVHLTQCAVTVFGLFGDKGSEGGDLDALPGGVHDTPIGVGVANVDSFPSRYVRGWRERIGVAVVVGLGENGLPEGFGVTGSYAFAEFIDGAQIADFFGGDEDVWAHVRLSILARTDYSVSQTNPKRVVTSRVYVRIIGREGLCSISKTYTNPMLPTFTALPFGLRAIVPKRKISRLRLLSARGRKASPSALKRSRPIFSPLPAISSWNDSANVSVRLCSRISTLTLHQGQLGAWNLALNSYVFCEFFRRCRKSIVLLSSCAFSRSYRMPRSLAYYGYLCHPPK